MFLFALGRGREPNGTIITACPKLMAARSSTSFAKEKAEGSRRVVFNLFLSLASLSGKGSGLVSLESLVRACRTSIQGITSTPGSSESGFPLEVVTTTVYLKFLPM